MKTTITPAICGFCGGDCLVDLHCRDGRVVKVEGNRTLPFSDGRLCVKGAALKQAIYSPDRLLYPMKRLGERGEGGFERITWEEALDTIAGKMKETKEKYGAKSAMVYVGHPKWFRPYLTDFANHYGTPNVGSESSTCAYAFMLACKCCFGTDVFMPQPENEKGGHMEKGSGEKLLCWFVQKDKWPRLQEKGLPDYLRFAEDQILFLKE